MKKVIPTNNLIWFPSLRLSILIIITLAVEMGLMLLFCILCELSQDLTTALLSVVILGNMITGLIGWTIQNFGMQSL